MCAIDSDAVDGKDRILGRQPRIDLEGSALGGGDIREGTIGRGWSGYGERALGRVDDGSAGGVRGASDDEVRSVYRGTKTRGCKAAVGIQRGGGCCKGQGCRSKVDAASITRPDRGS